MWRTRSFRELPGPWLLPSPWSSPVCPIISQQVEDTNIMHRVTLVVGRAVCESRILG